MKKKSLLAYLLVFIITFSTIKVNVFANNQLPVDSVQLVSLTANKGYDPVYNVPVISQDVTIQWEDPAEWEPSTTGTVHSPNNYLIQIKNLMSNAIVKSYTIPYTPERTHTSNVSNYYHFDPANLYEITVIPQHTHSSVGEVTTVRPSVNKSIKILTDVNVSVEGKNNQISVSWDKVNMEDVSYKITYAQIDYNDDDSRSKFENSSKKYYMIVDQSMWKENEGGTKLNYVLTENVEPAKPYAITVEPIVNMEDETIYVNNRPAIFSAHTTIGLQVIEDGDYIRFEWDINDSFKLNESDYTLTNTTIYEFSDGSLEGKPVVTFPGANGAEVHYYKIKKKFARHLEYQLVLEYQNYNAEVKSAKVPFVATGLKIEPITPSIPKPISQKVINKLIKYLDGESIGGEMEEALNKLTSVEGLKPEQAVKKYLEQYVVQGYTYDINDLQQLIISKNTSFVSEDFSGFNLIWSAFRRKDFNESSATLNSMITDLDVYYDIWVTTDLSSISSVPKVKEDVKFNEVLNQDNFIKDALGNIIGLKLDINQYADPKTNTLRNLAPNQLYYIKIVAKKKFGTDTSVSEPAFGTIYFNYSGDTFAPPAMAKPPLKLIEEELTKESARMKWRNEWYEVIGYTTDTALKTWEHEIFVKDGTIYKEEIEGGTKFILNEALDLKALKLEVGETEFNNKYLSRKVDLGRDQYGISDVKYRALRINYEEAQQQIELNQKTNADYNLENYIKDILDRENREEITLDWKDISPEQDAVDEHIFYYTEAGLLPNHSYVMLIRPYRELANGDEVMAYYPSSLVISTPEDSPELNPTPGVPYLGIRDRYSDSEVTLTWDYNNDFEYDIMVSGVDDVELAKPVNWSITDYYEESLIPDSIDNFEIKVKSLFPNSDYFFFIRAKTKGTDKISEWSNGILGQTNDLENPLPPKGIGMGSKQELYKHDIKEPVGTDYITVQWLLNTQDNYGKELSDQEKLTVEKKYSYILEVSDNPQFLDVQRMIIGDESIGSTTDNFNVLDKNLVLLNNLIANRVYYIRMKTKVEVSDTEKNKVLTKESDRYSYTVWVITAWSGDEYDGSQDPTDHIMPKDDFEVNYDKTTDTLTYRFRGYKDEDNNADQRLISDIIKNNIHEYEVDVRKYKNEPVKRRIIEIPDNIVKAFDDYGVDLILNAGQAKIRIPSEAFKDTRYDKLYAYGDHPKYQLIIDTWSSYKQSTNKPSNVAYAFSQTQQFKALVLNDLYSYTISYTEKPIGVSLRPKNRYSLYENEIDTYEYDFETKRWARTDGKLDIKEGVMSFDTGVVGAYGIYGTEKYEKPIITEERPKHWSDPYAEKLGQKLNLIGINQHNPEDSVPAQVFYNILVSKIKSDKDINLNQNINRKNLNQLYEAGFVPEGLLNAKEITRLDAINMLIKCFELLDGRPVEVYGNNSSSLEVTTEKAQVLGLIEGEKIEVPNDNLKYGQLYYMLEKLYR